MTSQLTPTPAVPIGSRKHHVGTARQAPSLRGHLQTSVERIGGRRGVVAGPGILHLGLGAFHRAHQAVYTAEAMARAGGDWGIVGAAFRSPAVVDALHAQDRLYTVVSLGGEAAHPVIVDAHTDAYVAAGHPETTTGWVAAERVRVVTLTITERGYPARPDGGLAVKDPDVAADLLGRPPETMLGQLAAGLRQRRGTHGRPLAIASCDNLPDNGGLLRRLVLDYVERAPWPDRQPLTAWIESQVAFPSSVVDRVVPAVPAQLRADVRRDHGYDDRIPVAAEAYTSWVLEDDFPAGRPQWQDVGGQLVADVRAYQQAKLRLVNAPHSLVAYLGLLAGCRTIDAAVAVPDIAAAARHLIVDDLAPTFRHPDGLEPAAAADVVLQRFANPAMSHRTAQVGSDGSLKLRARLIPALDERPASSGLPRASVLLVAAYLQAMTAPKLATGLTDPLQPTLQRLRTTTASPRDFVAAVRLETDLLAGPAGADPELVGGIVAALTALTSGGVARAVAEMDVA